MKQIDVVYILGSGSRWGNNELRYSLRSLQRFGLNYRNVYIVGANPGFLRKGDGLQVIKCDDPHKHGCLNHIAKVSRAIEQIKGLSDDFVVNYDDNFFLRPVDLSCYPAYYRREELTNSVPVSTSYTDALVDTRLFLDCCGKPRRDFEVHCPAVYNKDRWLAMNPVWTMAKRIKCGMLARSLYYNWHGISGVQMDDCKIGRNIMDVESLRQVIDGRHVFSISDASIPFCAGEFLQATFPEPSKWER